MIRDVKILLIALFLTAILLTGTAIASMPPTRGASYHTVYLDRGIKGSVSGKVVSSLDQSKGIAGAYVGVVGAINNNVEYANTTTDDNGNYNIGNLGATYSSTRHTGSDGTAGTLDMSENMLMLYVNKSGMTEQYSSTFGIDANHTNTIMDPVVLYGGVPDSDVTATPTPGQTVQPTVVVPTSGSSTATPGPSTPAALPPGVSIPPMPTALPPEDVFTVTPQASTQTSQGSTPASQASTATSKPSGGFECVLALAGICIAVNAVRKK